MQSATTDKRLPRTLDITFTWRVLATLLRISVWSRLYIATRSSAERLLDMSTPLVAMAPRQGSW